MVAKKGNKESKKGAPRKAGKRPKKGTHQRYRARMFAAFTTPGRWDERMAFAGIVARGFGSARQWILETRETTGRASMFEHLEWLAGEWERNL